MGTCNGMRKDKSAGSRKTVSPVKGGWVKRESVSGRFVEVHGESGTSRPSRTSKTVVDEVSRKRSEALKRLADR